MASKHGHGHATCNRAAQQQHHYTSRLISLPRTIVTSRSTPQQHPSQPHALPHLVNGRHALLHQLGLAAVLLPLLAQHLCSLGTVTA
jgi:hypothetical protein